MRFRWVEALRGPNLWSRVPALEALVELGEFDRPLGESEHGGRESLASRFPRTFAEVGAESDPARLLALLALELQNRAGVAGGFAASLATPEAGVRRIVLTFEEEALGRACLETARQVCVALLQGRPFVLDDEFQRLDALAQDVRLGPSTAAIVQAAQARDIPTRRLNAGSLVQLGHGARQRRIWTAETDATPAIAESIAQDKELTRSLLQAVGVPVPEGRPVADAEDAWAAALEIDQPVVVKPQFGNHGRGVTTDLTSRSQVIAAYEAARAEGEAVIVERYARGEDHRLLVIGGKLVAAARREPAHVVGDGAHTIEQLVAEVNRDPRRSEGHATVMTRITLDDAIARTVLAEQGFTPEAIPPAGRKVLIRRNANLSTGGTAADVTDSVHPEVAAQAVEAARVVGLDIAGVDLVAEDISRPLAEQGGIVVEVNAGPGLRMHLAPSSGQGRPVGEAIIEMLFPEGRNGRIPIVAVTGVNGKTTTTRLIAHVLARTGLTVGSICTDGTYIGPRRIQRGDHSGPRSARALLLNPAVELAVLETARGGIVREGLGFDRCDVVVVTNIGEGDHLGQFATATLDDLTRIKRVALEAVASNGTAVLNADDRRVADMAAHTSARIIWFALECDNPIIRAHRDHGGAAFFVSPDGAIIMAEGDRETVVLPLARVPSTLDGRAGFQVANALAAAAAAHALGVALPMIREGLETFNGSPDQCPGRMNVFEARGATIVVDYAHNPTALTALIQAIAGFPHRRKVLVYTPSHRRDEDVVRQGEAIAEGRFDQVILYEKADSDASDPPMSALLRQGLAAAGPLPDVLVASGERAAITWALDALQAGDLLVIGPSNIEADIALIQEWIAERR